MNTDASFSARVNQVITRHVCSKEIISQQGLSPFESCARWAHLHKEALSNYLLNASSAYLFELRLAIRAGVDEIKKRPLQVNELDGAQPHP